MFKMGHYTAPAVQSRLQLTISFIIINLQIILSIYNLFCLFVCSMKYQRFPVRNIQFTNMENKSKLHMFKSYALLAVKIIKTIVKTVLDSLVLNSLK